MEKGGGKGLAYILLDCGLRSITGSLPALRGCPKLPLPKFSSFLMPTFLGSGGQLLPVGYNTCPPCPDFSLFFYFSITFDL
jgi:hypothetical protein